MRADTDGAEPVPRVKPGAERRKRVDIGPEDEGFQGVSTSTDLNPSNLVTVPVL
jgi:hypothetical protein